jgi:ABC-type microcin C transport system permease subunit YejB
MRLQVRIRKRRFMANENKAPSWVPNIFSISAVNSLSFFDCFIITKTNDPEFATTHFNDRDRGDLWSHFLPIVTITITALNTYTIARAAIVDISRAAIYDQLNNGNTRCLTIA